ncbi:uncharacterized protein LOC119213034 [Pungitius pungitius]|uniref:uncharacterized protein LOC119213034 n=1 Tax=Pungitius pungitius TaxID=134920 RepID=UPI002E10637B
MVSEVSLRVSWICLLMFSSGACFPFKNEYKYPYARVSTSPTPALALDDDSPKTFQSGPAAYRPPAPGSSTGNQSPLSLGSPNQTTGSSPRYQPNQFVPDASATRSAPVAPPKVPGSSAYAPPAGEALRNSPSGASLLGPGPYQGLPAAGADPSHYWRQSWVFPHFSVWDTAARIPPRRQGRPFVSAPLTVITQSRNGYWRSAVRSSRSRYIPEY